MVYLKRRIALWMVYILAVNVMLGGITSTDVLAAKKEKVIVDQTKLMLDSTRNIIEIKNAKPTAKYTVSVDRKGIVDLKADSFFDWQSYRATKNIQYYVIPLKAGKVKVTVSKTEGKKTKKLKQFTITVNASTEYDELSDILYEYENDDDAEDEEDYEEDYVDDNEDEEDLDSVVLRYGDKIRLAEGSKCYLGNVVEYYDSIDPATIHVESDDSSIVEVDGDILVAHEKGSANIALEMQGYKFSFQVIVEDNPGDSYSKLAAKLEGYKTVSINKKNCVDINNSLYKYQEEDVVDRKNRILLPVSYNINLLGKRLYTWLQKNTSAADTGVSPQGLRIKKMSVVSSKKVKITLKKKLNDADILWLNCLEKEDWRNDHSISDGIFVKKYSSGTKVSISIPLIDKKTKKAILLTGKVKSGQKTITLKANKTIKKKNSLLHSSGNEKRKEDNTSLHKSHSKIEKRIKERGCCNSFR